MDESADQQAGTGAPPGPDNPARPRMLGISAVVQIPILLAGLPVYAQQGEWYQRIGDPTFVMELEMLWGFFGTVILVVLVATILGTFGSAATVYVAGPGKLGDHPSFGEVFRALWRLAPRLLGYLGVWVLGSFLFFIGLFVVLFIVILVASLVAPDSGLGLFWTVLGMLAIFVLAVAAVVAVRLALSLSALVFEGQTPIGATSTGSSASTATAVIRSAAITAARGHQSGRATHLGGGLLVSTRRWRPPTEPATGTDGKMTLPSHRD